MQLRLEFRVSFEAISSRNTYGIYQTLVINAISVSSLETVKVDDQIPFHVEER